MVGMDQFVKAKSIYRPRPVSGFPEWLPEQRLVELKWLDEIRAAFESFGFCSIETPSVEELDVLLAKGETDKEIYTLKRLQGEEGDEARLGLHYDVTVPFARYTAQHFNDLVFPFKRYQMQRVWRGERPQEGRFREFMQCDIDVINVDNLPLHFDAEIPAIVYDVLRRLGIDDVRLHISNRKILEGYLRGLAVDDATGAIRVLDKLDKIGAAEVIDQLEALGLERHTAGRALGLAEIKTPDASFAARVRDLGVSHPLLDEGLSELAFVMNSLAHLPPGAALADLSIARGFDYYTGTVYEGRFTGYPGFGSVVAGGRYDDLAGTFINKRLPGVGISLGLTRLFAKMLAENRVTPGPKTPTQVLIALPSEESRGEVAALAARLRARGLKVEMFHAPSKLARQLTYASKKGIPHVWFPPFEPGRPHEVKEMASGEQHEADPAAWMPRIQAPK
jgi:histidyl-tRNA synthetase